MPSSVQPNPDSLPTVFMIITQGFRIRSMLFSDVLPGLIRDCRLVILVPEPDVAAVRREFGGERVLVEAIRTTKSRLEKKLYFVRRNLLSNPKRNRTISVFSMSMKKEEPFNYWLIRFINPIAGRFRFIRDAWMKFESWLISGEENHELFERYRPSLVVTTDYGSHPAEVRLLRYAHKRAVPTASIVYSWDNLSSKGVMGCHPQKLIVWNEIMKAEAIELHDLSPAAVEVCGAAQFDPYGKPEEFLSREALCKKLRLDPARPIIVQGTIAPKYFSGNYDILDILVKAVESGHLPKDCQIVVRLHPQTVNKGDPYSDELQPYRDYETKYPFVRIDIPETVCWGSLVSPGRNDGKHLGELLYHAAVLIHPGSTLVVDASAVDCPCIGLAFDGYKERPYEESIRRWWDYTYMEPIIRSEGQPVAKSSDQLLGLINAFLNNRNLLAEKRAVIRDWECYRVDGLASERIVASLKSMVRS